MILCIGAFVAGCMEEPEGSLQTGGLESAETPAPSTSSTISSSSTVATTTDVPVTSVLSTTTTQAPATTLPPTTFADTTTLDPTTTIPSPTTAPTTAPLPPPVTVAFVPPLPECDPNYEGDCVPIASDVDCAGGSGNGPAYVRGPVYVVGSDIYDLDGNDNDGIGCEG